MAVARLTCHADIFGSNSYHSYYHIMSVKIQICSVVSPTKPAQAISSIFSTRIQLGQNWHQSTTKMAVTGLRCDGYSFGIISYHSYYHIRSWKRHLCSFVPPTKPAQDMSPNFQPKHSSRAKLAPINYKKGCGI